MRIKCFLYIKNVRVRLKFDFRKSFLSDIPCKVRLFTFEKKTVFVTLAYLFKKKINLLTNTIK